ncbi:MAG: 2-dehydropantoate 2-reductase [Rhodocyclales bacterium]|nr:2-dehydropantoate 2-reductase [Rhodocyclales bacterium]
MKIAVVGAGAIGGYLGAKLALAGEEVTFIARGANLAALQANGIRLILEDGTEQVAADIRAVQKMAEAGPQDAVLLTLKAHQVKDVLPNLRALFGPETMVVTMQNGIPWWYFHKLGGPFDGRAVASVDPDGAIAATIEVGRVIGSVVYPASELAAPGVVRVIEGNRFSLGELDGSKSPRIEALSQAMIHAGFKSPVSKDIRSEIWLKLWGNLSFNPISALTHATLADICQFPATRELVASMMREAQAIGEKLGVEFKVSLEKRIAGAEAVGRHKTSMLQDVEQGRALELDALVGAVVELGRITGTPTPHIDAIYACTSLLAKTLKDGNGRLAPSPRG